MKNVLKLIIECCVVCFALMLIVHCRVIAAYITGDKMPGSDKCPRNCHKHCK